MEFFTTGDEFLHDHDVRRDGEERVAKVAVHIRVAKVDTITDPERIAHLLLGGLEGCHEWFVFEGVIVIVNSVVPGAVAVLVHGHNVVSHDESLSLFIERQPQVRCRAVDQNSGTSTAAQEFASSSIAKASYPSPERYLPIA